MKYSYFIIIVLALILGYLCASFIISNYSESNNMFDTNVYFLQVGVYSNLESLNNDLSSLKNKITIKEDNKYYSYIGLTSSLSIAEKIKKMYQEQDVDIYIKKSIFDDNDFYNQLVQYDILLKNSNNIDEINSVLKPILATYEEKISNL